MEESGSEGLDELVQKESLPGGWFHGVDAVCIVCDNHSTIILFFANVVQ